jgi:polyhydroxybutyrate depolymerase
MAQMTRPATSHPRRRAPGALRPARAVVAVVATMGAVALLAVVSCSSDDDGGVAVATTASTADTTTTTVPVRTSSGCGTDPAVTATEDPSGDVAVTIDVDGRPRSYRLAVPRSYDPSAPTPLVLDLHGSGSNAAQQSVYSQIPARAADRGYLVVTPDAIDGQWELAGRGSDDHFLMTLLDRIGEGYCVDLDRVHATGISLGSWKATITACSHPDRFASLVLVAEEVAPDGCALPVVAFHGTADRVVPYGAGADPGVVVTGPNAGLPGVEVNMPAWAANGGCSTEKDVVTIGADVDHWIYRGCPDGMDVELYSIRGGGHTWPGSPIDRPGTTRTVDATAIALDWFDAHALD